MSAPDTKPIVDAFTEKLSQRLNIERLDGPVRLDNTHTVVIIPVKGKGPIHTPIGAGVDDEGVESVVRQISAAPGLKGLLRE